MDGWSRHIIQFLALLLQKKTFCPWLYASKTPTNAFIIHYSYPGACDALLLPGRGALPLDRLHAAARPSNPLTTTHALGPHDGAGAHGAAGADELAQRGEDLDLRIHVLPFCQFVSVHVGGVAALRRLLRRLIVGKRATQRIVDVFPGCFGLGNRREFAVFVVFFFAQTALALVLGVVWILLPHANGFPPLRPPCLCTDFDP